MTAKSTGKGILLGVALALIAACGGAETTEPVTPIGDGTSTSAASATEAPTTAGDSGTEAPIELAGTSWDVTYLDSASSGGFTNIWSDTEITLEFGSDETISGNAGCNDYTGTYRLEGPYITDPDPFSDEERGQTMSVEVTAVTEVACESEKTMEQEAEYLDVLAQAGRWLVGPGFSGDGSLIIRSATDRSLVEAVPAS